MTNRIEDYAMIGDCKTAALVGIDGSIDWLCLPHFDSGSCFTALLGDEDNGCWRIAPAGDSVDVHRRYDDGSLVLHTLFKTPEGQVELVDFMPIDAQHSHIVRVVRGISGSVAMRMKLVVRFDYGSTVPWVSKLDEQTHRLVAGADQLILRCPVDVRGENAHSVADFIVAEGRSVAFVLSHRPSYHPLPRPLDVDKALRRTLKFWHKWSDRCMGGGPWDDLIKRSLMVLKGLSFLPTGGIVAAPTTSLPEYIGSERNWDYRYCWLRDATLTLLALLNAGYVEEALAWRDWLIRAVAGSPDQIQIMYSVRGERRLDEWTIPWLSGYEGSCPVRVGNAAAKQLQLDIFGELSHAMAAAIKRGLPVIEHGLAVRDALLGHLETIWDQPDQGIWETRAEPRHFVHSKVMAWVAFDRAASSDHTTDPAKRQRYRAIADRIHASVCTHGVDPRCNCFTQSYGSPEMDASLLLIAGVGFLPPDDERIRNTVAQIEKRLLVDGLVLRYETQSGVDGLPPGEGAFLACSFWLVDNYVALGELDKARALFERLIALGNDVGLFAEEYDPRSRRHLGNFPQAFTHVALVNAAFTLTRALQSLGS
ncbi:MAG TPA: glycoside hydrolase family 15 protein [Dyella sp.]|uniref:glycoside hydrolase family 15 protein n=1 Tax=Dyella sp. TaxID=1869338 RepID=UPI002F93B345